MKLLYVLVFALVSITSMFPPSAGARGKEKASCPCGIDYIDSIVGLSCVDSSLFSKGSRGRGYFYAEVGWEADGSCAALISDGQPGDSECAVTRVGTSNGSGGCTYDGFTATDEVSSKEEGRACVTLLREIDRYLDGLPSCAP